MLRRAHIAALLLPLTLATPAFGQATAEPDSRQTAFSREALAPPWVQDDDRSAPPTSVGGFAIRAEDQGGRKRVVGSWELADNVDIGVGLIEIQHKNPRARRERVDPMGDVLAPDQKIAAVGLSFRF